MGKRWKAGSSTGFGGFSIFIIVDSDIEDAGNANIIQTACSCRRRDQ
jgi:hypothetical protein